MLLFWYSWFKYRFIKLDLVTVGKFCFHFSHVLGDIVDCVNVCQLQCTLLNYALLDVQNVCAETKVGKEQEVGKKQEASKVHGF